MFQCSEKQETTKKKIKIINEHILKNEKQVIDIDVSNDEKLFPHHLSLVFENFLNGFIITSSPTIDFDNPKHYRIKIYSVKTKNLFMNFRQNIQYFYIVHMA
ncbi:hypothetical protein [Caldicellulosiruptor naganoensis]|uniref:Uncharacterized protein n=1 Tax=Caldicellulosiruptor naganoensis TaxID=29324 RepID=A0ABY7BFU1_9FIRM|nr:hypothetical protein [Caldicellulosiruptor naganoensis]WAM31690.1 hypothetical protein OTJ99_000123 [Caldicellulosiruptor naganoensis]